MTASLGGVRPGSLLLRAKVKTEQSYAERVVVPSRYFRDVGSRARPSQHGTFLI